MNERSDHIFVAVRDEHAPDPVLILFEVLEIGDDHLHAELFVRIRIADSALNHKNVVIILNYIHVLAVFVETAEGKNTYSAHRLFLRAVVKLSSIL